jgi:hypothetical protein
LSVQTEKKMPRRKRESSSSSTSKAKSKKKSSAGAGDAAGTSPTTLSVFGTDFGKIVDSQGVDRKQMGTLLLSEFQKGNESQHVKTIWKGIIESEGVGSVMGQPKGTALRVFGKL